MRAVCLPQVRVSTQCQASVKKCTTLLGSRQVAVMESIITQFNLTQILQHNWSTRKQQINWYAAILYVFSASRLSMSRAYRALSAWRGVAYLLAIITWALLARCLFASTPCALPPITQYSGGGVNGTCRVRLLIRLSLMHSWVSGWV